MCHTPIVSRATGPLLQWFDNEIYPQNGGRHVQLMPIRASALPIVVFSGIYENHEPPSSRDARGIVSAHRHDHQNGQQSGYILHRCFVSCCPGGRRGNTEQEAVQWQRPVAPGVAPDMLNWVMRSVWLQCVRVTIKVAHDWPTFFRRHLFWLLLSQPKTMLWSIKINSELDYVFYYVIN